MAAHPWITRPYVRGDELAILELRRVVFGDVDPARLLPDVWRWQFGENPAGPSYIRLAEHGRTLVGQYAAIPTRFRVGNAERTFAMSCDTMTHPAYQKQGIFGRLARELYSDVEENCHLNTIWGFPNASSHPGFVRKLSWFDVGEFPTWVRPIKCGPLLERYLKHPGAAKVLGAVGDRLLRRTPRASSGRRRTTIRPIFRFDERFDRLWSEHCALATVVQVRDARFLNWRFFGAPVFGYDVFEVAVQGDVRGYFVMRAIELFQLRFAVVVDLFPCPLVDTSVTSEVLAFAEAYAVEQKVSFITALLPQRHAHELSAAGYFRVPRLFNLRRWILGCRCADSDRRLLGQMDNWHVTYADSDLV